MENTIVESVAAAYVTRGYYATGRDVIMYAIFILAMRARIARVRELTRRARIASRPLSLNYVQFIAQGQH